MLSRVVPGRSWTTERSSPISRLNRVDLPTLGRPTMATDGTDGTCSVDRAQPPRRPAPRASAATTASSRSPVPRPWRALTGNGSPRPSRVNAQASASRLSPSTLLATTRVGRPSRRSRAATLASSSVTPTVVSTTSRTTAASGMARSAWALTWRSRVSPAGQPAAGVDDGEVPPGPLGVEQLAVPGDARALLDDGLAPADDPVDQRALADVGPADHGDHGPRSCSLAPSGRLFHRSTRVEQDRPQRRPVGGHHLDRAGQVLGAQSVEERPPDRHTSGSR